MNQVSLIGRLTRDPDVRYTSGQMAVARFTIAIDTGYGDNKRTDFPNIVVFGAQAENCEKYLGKGRLVGITGRIQTGSYDKNGQKVYTTDVVASRVEFLDRGDKPQGNATGFGGGTATNVEPVQDMPDSFQALNDDLPFDF
ncbi:MAG: single-stranded DNA-binding protein [Clostridia bacterium]|nr:single-stranded DNA-binding protein [Clostridia bacterium]